MSYKFQDNTPQIISEENNMVSVAIRLMLEAIHKESRPKTPYLTGQLRGDVVKQVVGKRGSIKWGKKYAWYQERGYTSGRVRKYSTSGTGAHFAENSVLSIVKDSSKYFRTAGLK